jgi:hypothetical protein
MPEIEYGELSEKKTALGAEPSIPASDLPHLVASIMRQCGVAQDKIDEAIEIAASPPLVSGPVGTIVTEKDASGNFRRVKEVLEPNGLGGSESVTFEFPPNDEEFDKELERAQSHRLKVTVYYNETGGKRIISKVVVHRRSATEGGA